MSEGLSWGQEAYAKTIPLSEEGVNNVKQLFDGGFNPVYTKAASEVSVQRSWIEGLITLAGKAMEYDDGDCFQDKDVLRIIGYIESAKSILK